MALCECKKCGREAKPGSKFIKGHWGKLQKKKVKPIKLCECNCKKFASPGRKYIHGHNTRGIPCNDNQKKAAKLVGRKNKGRKHSSLAIKKIKDAVNRPENIQKLREHALKQLEMGEIGWGHGESYPEKIFREFLESMGAIKNVDFFQEHQVGQYKIDFAYIDKQGKRAIEIDGKQHETPKAIEHDRKRDKYLESNGWTVFRISVKNLKTFIYNNYDNDTQCLY